MRWAEIERRQPRLGEIGRARLLAPGVVLVVTLRSDRGRAEPEDEPETQRRYAADIRAQLGWDPVPGRFHLFRVDLESVAFLRYDDRTGDQFTATWPPAREFVRRGTTATSVGEPEPWTDLLVADDA